MRDAEIETRRLSEEQDRLSKERGRDLVRDLRRLLATSLSCHISGVSWARELRVVLCDTVPDYVESVT